MKNAILVHGWAHKEEFYDTKYPTPSNSHWFPWLTKQLMSRDIHTVAPEMPNSFYPEYSVWEKEFERFDINQQTILVGHSCGGGFIVRWLSENKDVSVGKVFLVAPWVGDDPDQPFDKSFFEFDWDSNIADRTQGLVIFDSLNDSVSVRKSVGRIKEKLSGHKVLEFEDKGHFTISGLGSEEFPELLEEVLR